MRGRILLVDDSVVVRKVVAAMLAADPEIESVATASNGRLALDKLPQVNPNLVILDIEMPEMGGIETLKLLRKRAPGIPVLMFSVLTERASALTLEALACGASDYVTKPVSSGSSVNPVELVRVELLQKVKALVKSYNGEVTGASYRPSSPITIPKPAKRVPRRNPEIVAIGSSTGGPQALTEILTALPANLRAPIVIAQHMPPVFTHTFAERLNTQCGLTVREGIHGERIRPGEVWIAPGDFHLTVKREGADLVQVIHQGSPENSCRPSVDVLFRSVAEACGPAALGVVLTGMGTDGMRGSECIRAEGGQVIVQDEKSSVVWSMPGSVERAGFADEVVLLSEMANSIQNRVDPDHFAVQIAPMGAESRAR